MLEDDEVECDCEEQSVTDFPDMVLKEQLKQNGYIVFKPTSVSELIAIEEKIKNFHKGG